QKAINPNSLSYFRSDGVKITLAPASGAWGFPFWLGHIIHLSKFPKNGNSSRQNPRPLQGVEEAMCGIKG
ncbi:MAG: hypothetical protein ACI9EH_001908, partial [Planktomarina sp.]